MKKAMLFMIFNFLLSSASYAINPEYIPGAEINLKYPIVMVHGIARNDQGKRIRPWGGIPYILRDNGLEVHYGNTDAWGSISSNAELLKTTIDTILENTKHDKVNIIAHSKGGIDSRYLIWKYDYGDKVASLTTISTPHHGSEIADLLHHSRLFQNRFSKRRLNVIGKLLGDQNPDIYYVSYELTTRNMNEFNTNILMDPGVYYQSIYSTMNNYSDDLLLSRSFLYIMEKSGENDGMVTAMSASWGPNSRRLPFILSHEQIIDHGTKSNIDMEISNIYLELIWELSILGF